MCCAFPRLEPATFSNVADDADVAVSANLPMHRATMDWSQAQGVAVRFEVPRSTQKDYDQELFSDELLLALALGLGRATDRLMLAAVAAATPAPFSLAAAAAQGLKAGELRALIGTSANGAEFRADGQLTAVGIAAELTADMAGTLVGAWDRAAIAISNDVHLLAERTAKNGTLAVTALAHMIPMLPDSSKFWSVA